MCDFSSINHTNHIAIILRIVGKKIKIILFFYFQNSDKPKNRYAKPDKQDQQTKGTNTIKKIHLINSLSHEIR